MEKITSTLRLRMSAKDAHYGGNLVDGAHMVHLFGDVATELLIKCDGDEGLFCAYDNGGVPGSRVRRRLHRGLRRDREDRQHLPHHEASRPARSSSARTDISASAADVLDEPVVVCRGPRHLRDPQGLPAQEDREVRERQDGEADYYCCYLRR